MKKKTDQPLLQSTQDSQSPLQPVIAEVQGHNEQDGSERLNEIITWLNDKTVNPRAVKWGKFGYGIGLLSSAFMILLGKDFAKRYNASPVLAYIFAAFGGIPLTLLISENTKNVFFREFNTPAPTIRGIVNPPAKEHGCVTFSRKFLSYFVAMLTSVSLTNLSHEKFEENANLITAIIFDIPALIGRCVLINWTVHNFFRRFIAYSRQSCLDGRNEALTLNEDFQKRRVIREYLESTKQVLQTASDREVRELHAKVLDGGPLTVKKLDQIFQLKSSHPELAQLFGFRQYLILASAVAIFGVGACYTLKPLGDKVFPKLLINWFRGSQSVSDIITPPFSWLAVGGFATLILYAQIVSFQNFFFAGRRTSQNFHDGLQIPSSFGCAKFCGAAGAALFVFFVALLSFLSSLPRIEINIEVFENFPEALRDYFNIGAGVSYFALDFWPLNDSMQRCLRSSNQRMEIAGATIDKLMMILPSLKREHVNALHSQITAVTPVTPALMTGSDREPLLLGAASSYSSINAESDFKFANRP